MPFPRRQVLNHGSDRVAARDWRQKAVGGEQFSPALFLGAQWSKEPGLPQEQPRQPDMAWVMCVSEQRILHKAIISGQRAGARSAAWPVATMDRSEWHPGVP